MAGNHSRYSDRPAKNYVQAPQVQGGPFTDADDLERQMLQARTLATLGETAIETGVPREDGVLAYETEPGPADVTRPVALKPGRVVADGRVGDVGVVEGESLDGSPFALLDHQRDLFGAGSLPADGPFGLVVDVWDRHVGVAEDGGLTDPAFLSAETAVRKQRVAQIKVFAIADDPDMAGLRAAVENAAAGGLPACGDLRLVDVEFAVVPAETDACDPCAETLADDDFDAGNHNFRFEIHDSGRRGATLGDGGATPVVAIDVLTVKWSRDNGSLEVATAAVQALLDDPTYDTAVFELTDLAGEQRLGLSSSDPLDRRATLVDRTGLEQAIADGAEGWVRVWDGAATLDVTQASLAPSSIGAEGVQGSIATNGTWTLTLTVGNLTLTFEATREGGPFILPGDAYSVDIREFAATDEGGGADPRLAWRREPVEVDHAYVFLGRVEDGAFVEEDRPDLRSRAFPALTDLRADDVSWSNHHHTDVGANTVQGALDLLFGREHSCLCTYVLDPDADAAKQLEEIAAALAEAKGSALICLPVGNYPITRPIMFKSAANLVLRGAGGGTVLDAAEAKLDFLLAFNDCASVVIEDLAIRSVELDGQGCILVETVGRFAVNRVSLYIDGDDRQEQTGIRVSSGATAPDGFAPAVEARESLFYVVARNVAIQVEAPARTIVDGCQFSTAFQSIPAVGPRIFDAIGFIDAAQMVERPGGRLPADRFFELERGARFVIDLGGIPEDRRGEARAFLQKALPAFAPRGGVTDPKTFAATQDRLSKGVFAVKSLAAEGFSEGLKGADTGGLSFEVLKRLGGSTDRPELFSRRLAVEGGDPALNLTLFGGFAPAATGAPPIALRARTDEAQPRPDAERALARASPVPRIIDELGIAETGLVNLADLIGGFTITAAAVEPLSFGVRVVQDVEIETQVVRCRFNRIAIAIHVRGAGRTKDAGAPGKLVIRDNIIRRRFRIGRDPRAGVAATKGIAPGAIEVIDVDSIAILDNTIQQETSPQTPSDAIQALGLRTLDRQDSRFAAIAIAGNVGTVIRVIGNQADFYRHCVAMTAAPLVRIPDESPFFRGAFYVFRESSVFPPFNIVLSSTSLRNWAVDIPDNVVEQWGQSVRLVNEMNHPQQ
jgi:hypothetical protein